MQQVGLIQSGCQQWIKQPAAIHGDQFAFTSSLAVFVHGSDNYKLVKLLAQQTQHINALCWSQVDANLIACSTAGKGIRIFSLETDAAVYSSQFPYADIVSSLCWATHDESILLASAGSTVALWRYKLTADWKQLHNFRSNITCMQQSATEPRLLAVGCADASMCLYDMVLQKVVCTVKLEEAAVPCDLQFDPLSKAFLLLLCSNGAISLYGINEQSSAMDLVSSLAKQPAARRCAAFVPNTPGNFAVISTKSGILQVWNVSQQQPLHSLKAGNGPAQSLNFFPGSSKALITFQDGTLIVYDVSTHEQLWCSQPGHTETIFDCCFAPGASSNLLATCSFDGTVRVWSTASNSCVKTVETRAPGRDEPVVVKGVPSNALYSVTWSPDCSLLAASSAGGAVYLFDYAKGIALKKWQLHDKPSLKVTWHPTKPNVLASSSTDGSVVAFHTDGSKLKVLQHSSPTSGCAWARDSYLLATTSEAGTVYVWDLNIKGDDCLVHSLVGHAKRSFSVLWSPLLPHLLLSGSDDATARVWDTQSGSCVALLAGHRTEVRALCWHPELPWLVLTGSWDSTIRCWDWRTQSLLYVCTEHHSDVYGLSIHSSCPWLLASASRDSTLRLWDLRGLAAGLLTRCFLTGSLPHGQAVTSQDQPSHILCGPASQQLADWVASHTASATGTTAGAQLTPGPTNSVAMLAPAACAELFARLSALFTPPGSIQALWQLAAAVAAHLGEPECSTPTGDSLARSASGLPMKTLSSALSVPGSAPASVQSPESKFCSASVSGATAGSSGGGWGGSSGSSSCTGPGCLCHLVRVKAGLVSAANQAELSVRGRGVGRAVMGASRREEVLQEAAMLHLQAGDAERCCELLAELGLWDKAVALAPAVSLSYWRQLLQRKADVMAKAAAPAKDLLPNLLAAGQVEAAVELLMRQQQYEQASSIAAVAACGGYARFAAGDSCAKPAAGLPQSRRCSMLSPAASLSAPFAALALQGSSPTHLASSSSLESPKGAAGMAYKPQVSLPGAAAGPGLTGVLSTKRNSLPPLRSVPSVSGGGQTPTSPNALPPAVGAVPAAGGPSDIRHASVQAADAIGKPGGPGRSRVNSTGSTTAALQTEAAAAAVMPGPSGQCGAAILHTPMDSSRLIKQPSSSLRHSLGPMGPSGGTSCAAAAAGTAMQQLESVCSAQVQLYRSQGEPVKAACAALMAQDVSAAVRVLHLGHEPEQAAMLCIALRAAGLQQSLVDRVFEALAIKCEAAGDWPAAALALGQLRDAAQHQQHLLVVRQEREQSRSVPGGQDDTALAESSSKGTDESKTAGSGSRHSSSSSLRQELQLHAPERYPALARSAAGPLESVRYLLLAHEHGHAAAKAVNSLQPILADLQQQVLQHLSSQGTHGLGRQASSGFTSASSGNPSPAGPQSQQLLACAAVAQLCSWHTCLESLDKSALPPPCWHDVFAHLLLTGVLKAFSYQYFEVGSFLLSRLRQWTAEHALQFPLSRAVLLLLEAALVRDNNPEAASSLLHAALACADAGADVRAAADHALQALSAHPHHTAAAAAAGVSASSSSAVVAHNSSVPHRPPPVTIKRSAVSGRMLSSGPWAYADDGCSLLSLSEAVMLSHVMRVGPYGSGLVLQLLV